MKTNIKTKILSFSLALVGLSSTMDAKVKLPALVSDGMILQRNQKVKIWGSADVGEKVEVQFQNKKYSTTADQKGNWYIMLPALKAGGPFQMTINEITLKDILVGDVWLASGQSNMELPMYRVRTMYPQELKTANNNQIRFFTVPQKYNFKEAQNDVESGSWEVTNPTTVKNFSAVAYFFAKELNEKNKVPVGIIHSSLGGSPVQAWMDPKTLKKYPEYLAEADKWKNDDLIKSTEAGEKALSDAWYTELSQSDLGLNQDWKSNTTDFSNWTSMNIPGSWEDQTGAFEGVIWFKKEINISKEEAGKEAFLNLGRIKDADETYVNGVKVGNVTYEYPPRWYTIPAGVLKEGKNIITIRVTNGSGKGEFFSEKPYFLEIDGKKIDLKGEWKYKIGTKMDRLAPGQTFIRWKPTGLYNAMINPLVNYNISGAIWYQGESNTGKPKEYSDLLSTMISDWRMKWNNAKMPFFIVQLSNFMETKSQPIESNWAQLRDEQRKVSQNVPYSGLVVANDLGETYDIHPLKKKDIGYRLSLQARKLQNDKNIVADGPVYQSVKFEGNKAILTFKKGTNDFKKVDELKGFSIKGQDGKWVWAKAKFGGDKIAVWSETVANPTAVRYAWADNPLTANLRNTADLPASSFTTE